jgi:hypothetical protein
MNTACDSSSHSRENPVHRCQRVSRSMPILRSSHGSRATSTSWNAISAAPYRPVSLPSRISALLPNPAWRKNVVTTATFTASTVYRPVRASTLGRTAGAVSWSVVMRKEPLDRLRRQT